MNKVKDITERRDIIKTMRFSDKELKVLAMFGNKKINNLLLELVEDRIYIYLSEFRKMTNTSTSLPLFLNYIDMWNKENKGYEVLASYDNFLSFCQYYVFRSFTNRLIKMENESSNK